MTKYKMTTIFDEAVGAYMFPQFFRSRGEAVRDFTDAVNDEKSKLHKYPHQYFMFEVGEWCDQTNKFQPNEHPVSYGVALDYKETQN